MGEIPIHQGSVAERLGKGLQHLLHQFDPDRHLMNYLKDTPDPFGLKESQKFNYCQAYVKYLQRAERTSKPLKRAVMLEEEKLKPALVSIGERAILTERRFSHLIFNL